METDVSITSGSGSTSAGGFTGGTSATGTGAGTTGTSASSSDTFGGRTSWSGRQSSTAAGMREELGNLKSDLDALMSHASTLTETELQEARDRILARFSSMRYAARGMATQAGQQFSRGRDMTVDYVRDKPLQSVAIAAGAGLLLGVLMRRD